MKIDLQFLAERRGIPLGRFVREILVQHFLGHTVWPDRFQEHPEQQIADNWVNGRIEAIRKYSDQVDRDVETPVKDIW